MGHNTTVTCEKLFGSPQTLCGHKTCHRKINIGRSPPAAAKTNEEAAKAKRHVGTICNKEFTTGPALGGHQGLHYQGAIGSVAEKEEEMAKVGGQRQEMGMDAKDEDGYRLLVQGAICHNIGSIHGEHPCRN